MEVIAVLLLVLVLLLAETALYRRYGDKGVSYRCRWTQTEQIEGETITFEETVENCKALPIPWLKAELTVPRWLDFSETHSSVTGDDRFVTSFFSIKSQAKVRRVWTITCQKRGVYAVEHAVLVTTDLLGAVRLSIPASDLGGTCTVLPRRYMEAGVLLPKVLRQDAGVRSVQQSWQKDAVLPAGLRAYAVGDPLNRMDWKRSLHMGTWLVRQEEPIAQQTVTVFLALETQPENAGALMSDLQQLEHTIRVCAQCLWELSQDGWRVRLCLGEETSQRTPQCTDYASGAEMYHRALRILAQLRLKQPVAMSRLLRSVRRAGDETWLLITPYTDVIVRTWKQAWHGHVLVTGHAHDYGDCADACAPMSRE